MVKKRDKKRSVHHKAFLDFGVECVDFERRFVSVPSAPNGMLFALNPCFRKRNDPNFLLKPGFSGRSDEEKRRSMRCFRMSRSPSSSLRYGWIGSVFMALAD